MKAMKIHKVSFLREWQDSRRGGKIRIRIVRYGRPFCVADGEVQERFELYTLRLYRDTFPLCRR